MTIIRVFSLCISLLSIFIVSPNVDAQSGFNLWKNVSPPGQGNIIAVECDYRNGEVYAAEETEGLFMSKNGGRNWNKIFGSETGIFNNSVGVRIPVNKEGVVFYALQNAVYKSADSGKNWIELIRYEGEGIVSFDINPASEKIYIAGKKWIDLLSGKRRERIFGISKKRGFSIKNISADPYLISRLYITFINGDTAFLQKKEGEWKEAYIKSPYRINLIASDPWTPGRIFAVAESRIIVKDDNDEGWKMRGEISRLKNSPCLPVSFLVSKRRKGLMFISYYGCGVYMSRNGGKKWVRISPNSFFVLSIAEKLPGRKIVCGTLGDGIILWTPSALLWKRRNVIGGYIKHFAYSNYVLKKIFAVTYSGRVFKSSDIAESWKEVTPRDDESFIFAESFASGGMNIEIAVDSAGNYYTRSDNNKWEVAGIITSEDKIVSLSGTTKGIYALTEKSLLYSYDGRKWKEVFSSDEKGKIRNIKVSPAATGKIIFISGNKIYIAENGFVIEDMVLPGENSRLLSAVFGSDETVYAFLDKKQNVYSRSNADGEWQIFASYPKSMKPSDLFICSNEINEFYILDINGNLYRTSDSGENWLQVYKNRHPASLTKAYLFCGENKVLLFNDYEGILKSDTGFSFNAGLAGTGWRAKMISFPINFIKKGKGGRTRLDRLISGKWLLYSVSKGETNEYKEIKYLDQLKNGRGYWLLYSGSILGTIPGNPSNCSSNYDLSLLPGWNMLANPFPYKIRILQIEILSDEDRSISIFSDNNRVVSRGVWKWSASKKKYIIPEIINPGAAFWVKNLSSEKIKMKINPLNNGVFRKSGRKNFVEGASLASTPPVPIIKKRYLDK